jgi:DNA-binding beta-propeller fold protein YncE
LRKKSEELSISVIHHFLYKGRLYLFLILLLHLIFFSNSIYGVELTYVRHLFDITHNFSQPSDVAVSKDGLIYVVDGVNNKIKVFDQNGKFVFSFGEKGSLNGQFMFPLGVGIDNSGRVYIADSGNHRIQVFSSTGDFITGIKIPTKDEIPADPTDVAADESIDRLYVVDNNNHYILIYELSTFKLIKTFGAPGIEEREFRYPFLIALDRNKYLYIVDVINTRVQAFNSNGLFVTVIGGWGVEKGQFFRPKGVATDKNNRVYVSDSYMGVIQVFLDTGEFHSVIGDPIEAKVKKFTSPVGIFIDDRDRLYVVEMFAEKVSVYKIIEKNQQR